MTVPRSIAPAVKESPFRSYRSTVAVFESITASHSSPVSRPPPILVMVTVPASLASLVKTPSSSSVIVLVVTVLIVKPARLFPVSSVQPVMLIISPA